MASAIHPNHIALHDLAEGQVPFILNYWFHSPPGFIEAMGVDLAKMPSEAEMEKTLRDKIRADGPSSPSKLNALMISYNGEPVGFHTLSPLTEGDCGIFHAHIWKPELRHLGIAQFTYPMACEIYFDRFHLKRILFKTPAQNVGAIRVKEKLGIRLIGEETIDFGIIRAGTMAKVFELTRDEAHVLANAQKIALDWIETVEGESGRIREEDIYPRLRKWVEQIDAKEILEIGSGQGICSSKIGLKGRHYTGIEPSSFLVARAKSLYSHSQEFLVGNSNHLPVPDGAFDAVFSVAVWHLLSDLGTAASELRRALKTGGHFLIITANPDAYHAWTAPYTDTERDRSRFDGSIQLRDGSRVRETLYLHSRDEITASLNEAGLKIEGVETFRSLKNSTSQDRFIVFQGALV